MAMWLLKTEPSEYSFDDLEREGGTRWGGVTQPHALLHLRRIEAGDTALIYHTGSERAVVGLAVVTRGGYPDPESHDPKRAVCDVRPTERLKRPVTLAQIKAHPALQSWELVRLARLSVLPVSHEQWNIVRRMAQVK